MPNVYPTLALYLHYRILQKFKEEYAQKHPGKVFPEDDSHIYGYDGYDYDPSNPQKNKSNDSIKKYIYESKNELVAKAIEDKLSKQTSKKGKYSAYNGHYLCKRKGAAEKWLRENKYLDFEFSILGEKAAKSRKEVKSIEFEDDYLKIFLAYIEVNDLEQLDIDYKASYRYYVGFYLSLQYFQIKNLILKISTHKLYRQQHLAEVIGFHAREGVTEGGRYVGTGHFEDKWLHINLQSSGSYTSRRMNLMAGVTAESSYNAPAFGEKFIRASIQATSANEDRLFNAEMFLYETTEENIHKHRTSGEKGAKGPVNNSIISNDADFRILSLYLTLHRNIHAFDSQIVSSLATLRARGNKVKDYIKIAGKYRIWNFNSTGDLVQSRFEISPEGLGHLYPYVSENHEGLKEHLALPEINTMYPDESKIVIITFGGGLNLINVAMFDIPSKGKTILDGVYSSLMYENKGIITGYIVMKKEIDDVIPMKIAKEQTYDFAQENNLAPFLNRLNELYKSHWTEH